MPAAGQAKFNRTDYAYSRAIEAELSSLAALPHESAFATDGSCVEIRDSVVVELERHFDQETSSAIVGTLTHSLQMFGQSVSHSVSSGSGYVFDSGATTSSTSTSSVSTMRGFMSGVSNAQLSLSGTTRSNLLGDALFSVLEFTGRDGQPDTMRVISMSAPAASQWMGDLIGGVSVSLGGSNTHSGQSVARWTGLLVDHYTPRDISYTTDRLKAMERNRDMTLAMAAGQLVGRNAILATSFRFSNGTETRLFPHQFPAMFGASIGRATHQTLALSAPAGPEALAAGGTHTA